MKNKIQLNNNIVVNLCRSNSFRSNNTLYQDKRKPQKKYKKKAPNSNIGTFIVLKLYCSLEETRYTAIDL